MKTLILGLLLLSSLSFAGFRAPPHLEMELRGSEYSEILARKAHFFKSDADTEKLQPVLDLGQRNLQFLQFINAHRDPAHQISLTSAETETGIPVEKPRVYNLEITYQAYVDLMKQVPEPLVKIVTGTGDFPAELPLPEEEYKKWGLKIDSAYQICARWLLMKDWLSYYTEASKDDIRGLYYLNKEPDLHQKLAKWSQLDSAMRAQYTAWLLQLCHNTAELADCKSELQDALAGGDVRPYFDRYAPLSQKHYDSYFELAWPRKDIVFSSAHPEVLHIPFVDPQDARVKSYLQDNIEDEWKWNGWNLRLDFQDGDPSVISHIEWQAGVTPHVDLPSTIVMDKNQPTTEYDAQWTIRHEFGHIMGFPDCYIEFYDVEKAAMVSYQLDISNLMCSRRGHFKQTHFDELKKTYYK